MSWERYDQANPSPTGSLNPTPIPPLDPGAEDYSSWTPADYASHGEFVEMAEFLRSVFTNNSCQTSLHSPILMYNFYLFSMIFNEGEVRFLIFDYLFFEK